MIAMDLQPFRPNLKQLEIRNSIITAWKSISNLVKLQNLVVKYNKVRNIMTFFEVGNFSVLLNFSNVRKNRH